MPRPKNLSSSVSRAFKPLQLWGAYQWKRYRAYINEREKVTLNRQYLPAVVELQQSPPSPTVRVLLVGLCTFITLALLWSILGRVDIVAVGQGKIIPSGRVKVIQPLETGVISKIYVEDGQSVKKGQPLLQMDLTMTQADRDRTKGDLAVTEANIVRINALLNNQTPKFSKDAPEDVRLNQESLYEQAKSQQEAELANLEQQLQQKKHEQAGNEATIKRLTKTIPLISERSSSYEELSGKGYVARSQFLTLEEQRLGQVYDLDTAKQKRQELEAQIQALREQTNSARANFRRTLLTELNEKSQQRMSYVQELAKAEQRNLMLHLAAPIDGTVQELKVHTVGGVVTPAEELMKVVPQQDALEAEVMIENKDIGFVHEGQPARVKLEAFPFTRYGLVEGHVKKVSLDAIQDEKLGLVYAARIALDKAILKVEDKNVLLTPGLSLTAEVRTGSRNIISYFLSPIIQHSSEAIRER